MQEGRGQNENSMTSKTPVRVVFNESNVATGLAEFQSGEVIGPAFGGTGLSSIGSAGQVLKVNGAGTALEFAAEGDVSITNLVAPTNADLTFRTSGTGNIVLDAITVNGTTLSAADSSKITVAEAMDVTGALVAGTSLNIAGDGATVTGIKDEDDMSSNSDTALATQQSIKAYVDSEVGSISSTSIVQNNSNVTVADTGTGTITVTVDGSTIGTFNSSGLQLGTSGARVTTVLDEDDMSTDSATALATQQSIKAFVESGSSTLSNKTFASPTITGTATINEITTNSITSNGSNADISIQPSGTGDVVISALRVNGTTLDSTDSSGININENVIIDGNLTVEGTVDFQDQNISNVGSLSVDSISGDADSNTSITFSGSDVITMATGGSTAATFNADQTTSFSGAISSSGNITSGGSFIIGSADIDETDLEKIDGITNGTVAANKAVVVDGSLDASGFRNLSATGTLTVTGATSLNGGATVLGAITAGSLTTNTISSNGSNADLSIQPSGTGDVLISALRINGTTLDSADSSKVTIAEAVDITGDAVFGSTVTANGGVIVDNITIDGTEIDLASGDLTLDVAGDIILDADNADIILQDNGTEFGRLSRVSSDFVIKSATNNKDIVFKGVDDSSTITALTLDMSEEGAATFNSSVQMTSIELGHSSDTTLTRASSGDVNIEGNIVYRAGGTDVAVADGGTGASSLTADAVLTGNGTSAITAEGNLSFDGSTLAVTGAATISTTLGVSGATTLSGGATVLGTLDAGKLQTNEVCTNGSNADLTIDPAGTGKINFYGAYTFPTSDGDSGKALITDGSGALSFGSVGDASASDDSAAVVVSDKRITNTARTIDAFREDFQDSVLYYAVINDHHLDVVNISKISLCHNDTGPFFTNTLLQSGTGADPTFSAESSNDIIRLKCASTNAVGGNVSFYKFGLGDNTSTGTSGNIIISQNTDVDSASESLVSFAHATFRGAKLFISINNNAKTEVSNTEALVVHDGTDAYITQFNNVNSGDNDMVTLTAAISGSNVVVSAAGLEPNLRVTVHAIMLKDSMTANDGEFNNSEAIGSVTISSTATEFDTLAEKSFNGAVYYLVSKNASEGSFAINEVMVALGSNDMSHASTGFVSTKGTNQIAVTSEYKADNELLGRILLSSTAGASTTVSGYRINLLAT